MARITTALVTVLAACPLASAQRVLAAHAPPASTAFTSPSLLTFDLQALRDPVVIEGLTTAMYEPPGTRFTFEVLIRDGTALGGTSTTGPGSSLEGWTSLGIAEGVQGPAGPNGVSLEVQIPRFVVQPGHITGVGLVFGSEELYVAPQLYSSYHDDSLVITTGDVRTAPFSTSQRFFHANQLVGSIFYDLAPCYPNCDGSTATPVLNVNDFLCFMGKFAAGDSYANCDASTTPPVLNVSDFLCFTQQFAGGCS